MSQIVRFGIGGLGGLLPLLASLVAVDLSSIATLIDHNGLTEGLCVGYAIRVFGLFALGGIMAGLNSEIRNPLALVQIGIAAPALVTSYMSGAALTKSQPQNPVANMLISRAFANESFPKYNIRLAGFYGDVIQGFSPGLGVQQDESHKFIEKPLDNPGLVLNGPFRVINTATKVCLAVPAEQMKSRDDYDSLLKSFPPPKFLVEPGVCAQ
jgi:hypothetical protein